jgi:hypothetical protein
MAPGNSLIDLVRINFERIESNNKIKKEDEIVALEYARNRT